MENQENNKLIIIGIIIAILSIYALVNQNKGGGQVITYKREFHPVRHHQTYDKFYSGGYQGQ